MKTSYKIIILSFVILVIAAGIITADFLTKTKEPVQIQNLEQMIDILYNVEFDISTLKQNYTLGEPIIITATLTNYNTTNITIFCEGIVNQTTHEPKTMYKFTIYDHNYSLIWSETAYSTDNSTNPKYSGLFGSYNITLQPYASTYCNHTWNQTYAAHQPPHIYGKQVPPGTYRIVAELTIDWKQYYGECYPQRHYGDITTITLQPTIQY